MSAASIAEKVAHLRSMLRVHTTFRMTATRSVSMALKQFSLTVGMTRSLQPMAIPLSFIFLFGASYKTPDRAV